MPDFTNSGVVSINSDGEHNIARACGCSTTFAREIVKERVKNGDFANSKDVEIRMIDYWDNELKQKRGKPFNKNLQEVISAINNGNLDL